MIEGSGPKGCVPHKFRHIRLHYGPCGFLEPDSNILDTKKFFENLFFRSIHSETSLVATLFFLIPKPAYSNTLLKRFFINYFTAEFLQELYLKIEIFTFCLKDFVQLFSDFLHINFLRLQILNRHCQFCIRNCVARNALHH